MGAATFASYRLFYLVTSSNSLSTMVSIIIAVIVYFVTVFKMKAVTKDEIEMMPKGDLIYRIAVKMRVAK
jgi:stage V sporulation protein B